MTEEDTFDMLYNIMLETRTNKRYGKDSMAFEADWVHKLVRMKDTLMSRTFRIEHNYTFLVSVPKWREIFATEFEGRIADHVLCGVLEPYIEKELHPRTFNNRKNMGTQAAINQVIEDITEVSQCGQREAWIIKWDLKSFFPNARRDYIEKKFAEVIDKYSDEIAERYNDETFPNFLKWLTMVTIHCCPAEHCEFRTPKEMWSDNIPPDKSIFNKPEGIGAPIGRWTSQVGMGLYINDEVIWLNERCGIKATVFMDDCAEVVDKERKEYALGLLPELRARLAAKGVRLNEKKFYCQQYWKGLEFLGSHIKPTRIILNDSTYRRFLERIEQFNEVKDKYNKLDKFLSSVNSYFGLLKSRTSYKRIQEVIKKISPEWWEWLEWNERRQCIAFKPGYSFNERLNIKYNLKIKNYEKRRKTNAYSAARNADSAAGRDSEQFRLQGTQKP